MDCDLVPLTWLSTPSRIRLCRIEMLLADMLSAHLVWVGVEGQFFGRIPVSLVFMPRLIRNVNILLPFNDTHRLLTGRLRHLLELIDLLSHIYWIVSIGRVGVLVAARERDCCLRLCLENDVLSASVSRNVPGSQVFEGVLVKWTGRAVVSPQGDVLIRVKLADAAHCR